MRRVLAIGAHPDDLELGCGGALLRHRLAGDRIFLLTMTRGERGGRDIERVEEARAAAAVLGAELAILEFADTAVEAGPALVKALEDAINQIAPTQVYTHSRADTHQDHRAVHDATIVAARRVPNIACYQSPSATVEFQPRMFVDISDVLTEKLELIALHRSQAMHRSNMDPQLIISTARYWGRFAGNCMAEPFEVMRQMGFI